MQVSEGGVLLISPPSTPEGESTGANKSSISFPGFLEIGRKANGIIELFDATTRLACDEAILGGDTTAAGGTLNVDTGATFDCSGSLTLGADAGPGLVRTADGANMTIGSSIIIGPQGLFITGVATVSSSNVVVNGRLRVLNALSIERPSRKGGFVGSVKGNGGSATIEGNLVMGTSGNFEVTTGTGSALIITGAATLEGTLEISLQPGVTFTDGQVLDLVEFRGGTSGSFATIEILNAPVGFEGSIELEGGVLRLHVINGGTVDPEGEGSTEGEGEGEGVGEGSEDGVQSADQDGDFIISLAELLRVIQFYNSLGYHCADNPNDTEDGYLPGSGANQLCSPYDTDYNPQDWVISLSELLRVIQLYNLLGYSYCPLADTEDGFCPGAP